MQNIISKETKIAVLCGGMSSEREVSLRSGKNCLSALHRLGYKNAEIVDVSENIMNDLKGFDYAYNTLHGKFGEDGCIQGVLEIFRIPYSGCGVMASAICMNKEYTKKQLVTVGLIALFAIPVWHRPAEIYVSTLLALRYINEDLRRMIKNIFFASVISYAVIVLMWAIGVTIGVSG